MRKGGKVLSFDSLHEYREWKERVGAAEARLWSAKYYKGLGTNSAEEGREYFRRMADHRIGFVWQDSEDDLSIEMAFSKAQADQRKAWLQSYDPSLTPSYIQLPPSSTSDEPSALSSADEPLKHLRLSEFIHKELILFSHADNVRSIPSMLDGLKPVQRKVLFASFRRRLTSEIKVAQLAGYVSEQTGYHHGEVSLSGAIVGMAQAYVGSNNLPLLYGSGQFGTRHMGGKDAASSRYIFTRLDPLARVLFDERDDALLTLKDEDGVPVEPEAYCPIIPLVLVNGAEGIGTGFSTAVPPFHPLDVIDSLKRRLRGEAVDDGEELTPWVRGFHGTVRKSDTAGVWLSEGRVRKAGESVVEVLELPWGRWTNDYKDWLNGLVSGEGSHAFSVRRVMEYHTNERVHFRIDLTKEQVGR